MDIKALFKICYGMYIVSSKNGDKFNGQIVNTVTQVTAEPVKISVCIHNDNLTHEYINKSRVFTVSILEKDTPMTLIGHFGFRSGKTFNKFENIEYKTGITGTPIVLANCTGYLECEVENSMNAGTHTIFLAKVLDAQIIKDSDPMTYAYYHMVKHGKSPKNAPTYNTNNSSFTSTNKQNFGKSNDTVKKEESNMDKYKCTVCGYIYDPEKGDPDSGVAPGTAFADIPEDWTCPICGVGKGQFEKA